MRSHAQLGSGGSRRKVVDMYAKMHAGIYACVDVGTHLWMYAGIDLSATELMHVCTPASKQEGM